MTLRGQIRKAVRDDDALAAGRIADRLRSHGFRYDDVVKAFNKASGIDAADFDALMYEADQLTSRG